MRSAMFLICSCRRADSHDATLSPVRGRPIAQHGEGGANVRSRRGKRVRSRSMAAHGWQTGVSGLKGCEICYDCRRSPETTRWRCKACRADFSITSGTLFAWHKLPLRTYLMAIAVFCNEVKGKSMLAFCRDLDVQYKTAFVLAHKLREAMASATRALRIGGRGAQPRSTAPISVATSDRRTWPLTESTG